MDSRVRSAYEKAKQYVGNTKHERLGGVRRQEFQRFAIASQNSNPIFFDDEYAQECGYSSAIAPPLFLSSIREWGAGPPEDLLAPDGTGEGDIASPILEGLRRMGAGQDLEFVNPVTDETTVALETTIDDIEYKEGKSGPMILVILKKRYVNGAGQTLVICRESIIGR